jgi:hypothetical protein
MIDRFKRAGLGALREQQAYKRAEQGEATSSVRGSEHEVHFRVSPGRASGRSSPWQARTSRRVSIGERHRLWRLWSQKTGRIVFKQGPPYGIRGGVISTLVQALDSFLQADND